jgi:hypothetical protein
MHRHLLLLICLIFAACQRSAQNSNATLATVARTAASAPEATEKKRPVYPYSIVEGGTYTLFEWTQAKQQDKVVENHYKHINPDTLKPLRLNADTSAYVSYRVGKLIFWTSRKINLKRGELVLSDGTNWVRGRCGNLISETPMFPTLTPAAKEPKPSVMDTPATLKVMNPYPTESLSRLQDGEVDTRPAQVSDSFRDKPNLPQGHALVSADTPPPISTAPAGFVPVGGGGASAPATSGTSPTPTPVVNPGYPPNPFLPPTQTINVLTNLPPYQPILLIGRTELPPSPPTYVPDINSAPIYITYVTPPTAPPPGTNPYLNPNYPPPTGPWPPTGSTPNPPGTPPPTLPPQTTPPGLFPPTDGPPLLPPELFPPETPPTNLTTPEPGTIVLIALSLLFLGGYYLLARTRLR